MQGQRRRTGERTGDRTEAGGDAGQEAGCRPRGARGVRWRDIGLARLRQARSGLAAYNQLQMALMARYAGRHARHGTGGELDGHLAWCRRYADRFARHFGWMRDAGRQAPGSREPGSRALGGRAPGRREGRSNGGCEAGRRVG